LVIERLRQERFEKLTIDFDGSVQSTKGHAEGTAVGSNKVKKGARSYYDLFATVAQTSQFFDRLHRPGNVHDSNGAVDFIARMLNRLKTELPDVALDLIPTRRKVGNQVFTLTGMLAHNLGRELQMATREADRGESAKRPACWEFESLGTIRQHLLHNAGILTRPQGELTLTMNANDAVRDELTRYVDGLMEAQVEKDAA
jgi:hypothetical protein